MTFKLCKLFIYIITINTFLWNQQTAYLAQKIAIENSYRDKVISSISRILGQEKFIVIVNIEFSTLGGVLKKSSSPQADQTATEYTPIPGLLPTVPNNQGMASNNFLNSKRKGENNFSISKIEINIGLDKELATGPIKPEIVSLIKKVIPEIRECEDCIKIESLQFLPNAKSKRLENLENQIAELEAEKRQAKIEADAVYLSALESQLNEAKAAQKESEMFLRRRERKIEQEDSIKFVKLIESEKNRQMQDSIRFANTEKRLEKVMDSKIRSDSLIISEAMDMYKSIMKQKGGGDFDNEALLGMQIGNSKPGTFNAIIFMFLIIALITLSYFAFNRKPKTIYLKPKNSEKENNKKPDSNEPASEVPTVSHSNENSSTPEIKDNNDEIIQSEIKSMRQTAVSMTVGEKEAASALIKDWLSDNPNKEDTSNEEEGE